LSGPSGVRSRNHSDIPSARCCRSQSAGGGFDPPLRRTRDRRPGGKSRRLRAGRICVEQPADPLIAARQHLFCRVRVLEPADYRALLTHLAGETKQLRRDAGERQVEVCRICRVYVAPSIACCYGVGRERWVIGDAFEQYIVDVAETDTIDYDAREG